MVKLVLLLTLLMLAGCESEVETSDLEPVAVEKAGLEANDASIEWFDGGIEEAFSVADNSAKPLFLYWGAVWCPPCQEIKHTVFKSQEFIQLTRLFVPVYLDGDTDEAQTWGEKFGVMGYPTMIVFNPGGEEITRIPGNIDISRYNSVLEISLNQMRSTSDLVQVALGDASQLSADEFYQLAYYSWFQDSTAVPEGTDMAGMFHQLSLSAPEGELSNRFYMNYLLSLAESSEADEEGSPEPEVDPAMVERLEVILSSPSLIVSAWDTIAYYMDEVLTLADMDESERTQLEILWAKSVFDLRFDESLSKAEKLAGWIPTLQLATRDDEILSVDLQDLLRAEMQTVDEATPDSYERQSVINQMSHIYREAGLKDDARSLLLAELEKSASPYYFMSSLGGLAEQGQNFDEALEWRRKAYENSVGEATRFQWGSNYAMAMIRMSPQDVEGIESLSLSLLSEFQESGELFAGRNYRVLKRLNEKRQSWQKEQGQTVLVFESEIERLCKNQVEASLQQQNCQALVADGVLVEEKVAQAS